MLAFQPKIRVLCRSHSCQCAGHRRIRGNTIVSLQPDPPLCLGPGKHNVIWNLSPTLNVQVFPRSCSVLVCAHATSWVTAHTTYLCTIPVVCAVIHDVACAHSAFLPQNILFCCLCVVTPVNAWGCRKNSIVSWNDPRFWRAAEQKWHLGTWAQPERPAEQLYDARRAVICWVIRIHITPSSSL